MVDEDRLYNITHELAEGDGRILVDDIDDIIDYKLGETLGKNYSSLRGETDPDKIVDRYIESHEIDSQEPENLEEMIDAYRKAEKYLGTTKKVWAIGKRHIDATTPHINEAHDQQLPDEAAPLTERFDPATYQDIQTERNKLKKSINEQIDEEDIADTIPLIAKTGHKSEDRLINELINLNEDPGLADDPIQGEQDCYNGTSYARIDATINALDPDEDDVIYDLGAGYGRLPIYGGLTTNATYKGIELVNERVDEGNETIEDYNIDNAELIASDVTEADISDGDMFYLFNPFTHDTFNNVLDMLEDHATDNDITIAAHGFTHRQLDDEDWLTETDHLNLGGGQYDVKLFTA